MWPFPSYLGSSRPHLLLSYDLRSSIGAVVEDRMTNGSSKTSLFLGRALSDYSARDSSSIFYPPRATSTKDSVEDLTASGSPTVDQRKGEPEA